MKRSAEAEANEYTSSKDPVRGSELALCDAEPSACLPVPAYLTAIIVALTGKIDHRPRWLRLHLSPPGMCHTPTSARTDQFRIQIVMACTHFRWYRYCQPLWGVSGASQLDVQDAARHNLARCLRYSRSPQFRSLSWRLKSQSIPLTSFV
jgi:hypothetical protein